MSLTRAFRLLTRAFRLTHLGLRLLDSRPAWVNAGPMPASSDTMRHRQSAFTSIEINSAFRRKWSYRREALEILKLLVDLVSGGAKLKEMKRTAQDRQKASDLGYELYRLYNELNTVYTAGARVARALERDIERLHDRGHYWKDRVLSYETLHALRQQRHHVRAAMQSIRRLEPILILVSPDVVRKLFPLIGTKACLLSLTSGAYDVNDNVLFAWIDANALQKAFNASARGIIEYEPEYEYHELNVEYENADEVYELYRHLERLEVPITSDNPQQYISVLQDFLERADLNAQLEAIAKALDGLRTDLLDNFDKKDLLLRVGDERQIVDDPYSL